MWPSELCAVCCGATKTALSCLNLRCSACRLGSMSSPTYYSLTHSLTHPLLTHSLNSLNSTHSLTHPLLLTGRLGSMSSWRLTRCSFSWKDSCRPVLARGGAAPGAAAAARAA